MLPALTIGAAGCVDGPLNMAPELWVEIWNAYGDGDLGRAEAAQDRASEVAALVRRFGLHATVKAVLSERLGIDCGEPRRPGLALSDEQRAAVLETADQLRLTRVAVVR
jgi:dihydrodipicolinate synthase/N-acetylneuraminate lyase